MCVCVRERERERGRERAREGERASERASERERAREGERDAHLSMRAHSHTRERESARAQVKYEVVLVANSSLIEQSSIGTGPCPHKCSGALGSIPTPSLYAPRARIRTYSKTNMYDGL